MTLDRTMLDAQLRCESITRRLVTARKGGDAMLRYGAFITYLAGVRELGRGSSKDDGEILGFNIARVERFDSPLRLPQLMTFARAVGVRPSALLSRVEIEEVAPIRQSTMLSRPMPDIDVAAARIIFACLTRMKAIHLTRTKLPEFTGMDRDLINRMFQAPSGRPIRGEAPLEKKRHHNGKIVGASNGMQNRPIIQIDCLLLALGLDLAAVLREPTPGEIEPLAGNTNEL